MSLVYEKEGRVATITLNRPRVLNALDRETLRLLNEAWADFGQDPGLGVLIVTGAGERSFCVGADLKEWRAKGTDPHAAALPELGRTPMRRTDLYKPVIAAINGLCLGGGFELALACDLRLASEEAVLGLPEIKRGIFPGQGATQRLPRILPYNLAAELILTGETITAKEAWRMGLVNRLTAPKELLPQARALAKEISELSPLALSSAKEALLKSYELPLREGLELEGRLRTAVGRTKDAREGVRAFTEKRKPKFKGR